MSLAGAMDSAIQPGKRGWIRQPIAVLDLPEPMDSGIHRGRRLHHALPLSGCAEGDVVPELLLATLLNRNAGPLLSLVPVFQ